MKLFPATPFFVSLPTILIAGEGHSHSIAGELEHLLPIIGVLLTIMVIGATYSFISKNK